MNRGSDRDVPVVRSRWNASMRPRFMNRGSDSRSAACRSLACGFNEAPIHESGKCRVKITTPQGLVLLQ